MKVTASASVTLRASKPPVPPEPPLSSRRLLRRWGDPVMTAWGYDVNQVGTTNWQNIALWNEYTGYGAISNYLWLGRTEIEYLRSLQFDEVNGVGEFHNQDSKMNWLCRDKGAIYLDAGEWKTIAKIKWGTTAIGGNSVTVEEYRKQRAVDKSQGTHETDVLMARVKCFRKADMGRPLDDLLAEGLVHRCYCVYKNNQFGDSPKGIVYSPMWSPLDWDFGGTYQPSGFWIPAVLMETI